MAHNRIFLTLKSDYTLTPAQAFIVGIGLQRNESAPTYKTPNFSRELIPARPAFLSRINTARMIAKQCFISVQY